uniref:Peptidase S1 domain-containing protein n=1 Tax=Steinernema glaseri TaxID=37863 RepID=A0A1I8AT89_9BILA
MLPQLSLTDAVAVLLKEKKERKRDFIYTRVWAGVSDISNLDPVKFHSRGVAKWNVHHGYNRTIKHNDIAVMELDYPFPVTDSIKPIKINVFDFASDIPDQRPYMISGYGATAYKDNVFYDTTYLHIGNTTIVNRETCR